MKKIIILKTGDTFIDIQAELGNFENWIIKGMGVNDDQFQIVDLPRGETLPRIESCKGVVIAGSHSMVTEELAWSVEIEKWIPECIQSDVPVLGICYGHQLLAKAMGGIVDFHPRGIEIGTVCIDIVGSDSSDPIFNGIQGSFLAHVCHSQTVVSLPENAICIAKNKYEPHHAFRIGSSAWGVQFHPEYDEHIMTAYVQNNIMSVKIRNIHFGKLNGFIKGGAMFFTYNTWFFIGIHQAPVFIKICFPHDE